MSGTYNHALEVAGAGSWELGAGRGPCAVGVQDADSGTTHPDTTYGFKAPVERFAERAAESRKGGSPCRRSGPSKGRRARKNP